MASPTDEDVVRLLAGKSSPRISDAMVVDAFTKGEPSAVESFARGVIKSPASLVDNFNSLVQMGNPGTETIRIGEQFIDASDRAAGKIGSRPTSRLNKTLERVGEQTAPAMIGAGAAGAVAGPLAALGEAGLAFGTPIVGDTASMLGASPEGAALAELGFNVAAPGLVVRALRGAGYRGPLQPGTHGVTARRAARNEMVPVDEAGGGRWADQAADELEASQSGLESSLDSRTSGMVLDETAPNFENLEIAKAQSDPKFQAKIGGRKMHVEALQEGRVTDALSGASVEPASTIRTSWKAQKDKAYLANEKMWNDLDLNGETPAPDNRLMDAIEDIRHDAGKVNSDTLPKVQINQIHNFNGKIPWSEMQRLRARFGAIAQEGSGPSPSAKSVMRKHHARKLINAIDETIEDASEELAMRYPEAIASHHRFKTTFDQKTKAFKAFDSQEDPRRLVSEVMDGRNAIQEARLARDMFGDDISGLGDFKAAVARDTLQPEVGPSSAKAVRTRYLKRRESMLQLWTPDEVRAFDEIVDAGVDASGGKAGRRGMNYGAGSATLRLPGAGGKNSISWLTGKLADVSIGNDLLKNRVMENYLMNPSELIPVLRARKFGTTKDVMRLLTMQSVKTMARTAGYADPAEVQGGTKPQGVNK